jgi:hypothetical protein
MGGLSSLKKKNDDPVADEDLKEKCNLLTVIGLIGALFNFAWLICGKHCYVVDANLW